MSFVWVIINFLNIAFFVRRMWNVSVIPSGFSNSIVVILSGVAMTLNYAYLIARGRFRKVQEEFENQTDREKTVGNRFTLAYFWFSVTLLIVLLCLPINRWTNELVWYQWENCTHAMWADTNWFYVMKDHLGPIHTVSWSNRDFVSQRTHNNLKTIDLTWRNWMKKRLSLKFELLGIVFSLLVVIISAVNVIGQTARLVQILTIVAGSLGVGISAERLIEKIRRDRETIITT